MTMKRSGLMLALCTLFAVVATTSALAAGKESKIPVRVQREIKKRYPTLAYGPTWLPSNYRFGGYFPARKSFQVAFSDSKYPDALTWSVMKTSRAACQRAKAAGVMKRYRLNGVTTYWGATDGGQEAWRCLHHGDVIVWLDADAGVPGDSKLNTPKRRHDAFVLAKAVAYAKPLT